MHGIASEMKYCMPVGRQVLHGICMAEIVYVLHLARVGTSIDSKASQRRTKGFLRSLTLRAVPLRWF